MIRLLFWLSWQAYAAAVMAAPQTHSVNVAAQLKAVQKQQQQLAAQQQALTQRLQALEVQQPLTEQSVAHRMHPRRIEVTKPPVSMPIAPANGAPYPLYLQVPYSR